MRVFDVRFLIADDFRSEEYAQSARKTTVCDLRLSPPVAVVDVAAGVASWDVRVFCRMGSSVGAESSRYGFENDMHWDGNFRHRVWRYRAVEFCRVVLLGENVAFVG